MTEISDEMVEAAAKELLAHAICTEGPDAENRRLMRIAARAALQAALSQAPQGWKLVPLEPTQNMLDEVCTDEPLDTIYKDENMRAVYKAMLSAAPTDKG